MKKTSQNLLKMAVTKITLVTSLLILTLSIVAGSCPDEKITAASVNLDLPRETKLSLLSYDDHFNSQKRRVTEYEFLEIEKNENIALICGPANPCFIIGIEYNKKMYVHHFPVNHQDESFRTNKLNMLNLELKKIWEQHKTPPSSCFLFTIRRNLQCDYCKDVQNALANNLKLPREKKINCISDDFSHICVLAKDNSIHLRSLNALHVATSLWNGDGIDFVKLSNILKRENYLYCRFLMNTDIPPCFIGKEDLQVYINSILFREQRYNKNSSKLCNEFVHCLLKKSTQYSEELDFFISEIGLENFLKDIIGKTEMYKDASYSDKLINEFAYRYFTEEPYSPELKNFLSETLQKVKDPLYKKFIYTSLKKDGYNDELSVRLFQIGEDALIDDIIKYTHCGIVAEGIENQLKIREEERGKISKLQIE